MYETALFKRNKYGKFVRVYHSIDDKPWRAKELVNYLKLFQVYRDGHDSVYVDENGTFKLYLTRLNHWW